MQTQKIALTSNSPLMCPPGLVGNTSATCIDKPKMAMVNAKTGEVMEVVNELTTAEERKRTELLERMKTYARNYVKKHPNTKPERLKRIVSKKFNVKLT